MAEKTEKPQPPEKQEPGLKEPKAPTKSKDNDQHEEKKTPPTPAPAPKPKQPESKPAKLPPKKKAAKRRW